MMQRRAIASIRGTTCAIEESYQFSLDSDFGGPAEAPGVFVIPQKAHTQRICCLLIIAAAPEPPRVSVHSASAAAVRTGEIETAGPSAVFSICSIGLATAVSSAGFALTAA